MKRTLTLKRETLTELTGADLSAVVGAAASGLSCPLKDCVQRLTDAISCTPSCGYTDCCPTANTCA